MRYPLFLSLTVCFACSSDPAPGTGDPDSYRDNSTTSGLAPTETSQPAPGVTPESPISGDANVEFTGLTGYPSTDVIRDCACALSIDGAYDEADETAYLFVYNFDEGPGVLGINGEEVVLEWNKNQGTTDSADGLDIYIHENDQYRVTSKLVDEGPAGDEGRMYSGTVRVEDKETGKWREARIMGDCSC
ncbi:hypothetical protein [Neolewinella antarctica]|uniref:Lipoprotein n=1 Tax=Neolewinella antarctica TaxID=442734 RepID=A0ABX0XC74_9BACT|nr:hypothetical protein [Neolewinella antarctica]NJC26876.1 hypothetical protein [Neolewinella antarctica]